MRPNIIPIVAVLLGVVATALQACRSADKSDLGPPFAVEVGGTPIDVRPDKGGRVDHDNAFPWFGDFDGDGKPDLLVGQHTHPAGREKEKGSGGRLRIYKNAGEKGSPRFAEPVWFDDSVPTGRIPDS